VAAHRYRIAVALMRNDYSSAKSEADIYFQRTGDRSALEEVEIRRLAALGHLEEARTTLHRALAAPDRATMGSFADARLEFAIGQTEQGYASLERAYRERSWWLVTMMVDPGFASVRTEQRFLEIARRVGLPVATSQPALAMRSGY